jgi:hypothetical protein
VTAHTHRCQACGHDWDCMVWMDKPTRKTCVVDEAARANKQGPWCLLCYHVKMAEAAADARGLALDVTKRPKP